MCHGLFVFRWACCCNPPPYGNACRSHVSSPLGALLYFSSLHPTDNAHRLILPVSLRRLAEFLAPRPKDNNRSLLRLPLRMLILFFSVLAC